MYKIILTTALIVGCNPIIAAAATTVDETRVASSSAITLFTLAKAEDQAELNRLEGAVQKTLMNGKMQMWFTEGEFGAKADHTGYYGLLQAAFTPLLGRLAGEEKKHVQALGNNYLTMRTVMQDYVWPIEFHKKGSTPASFVEELKTLPYQTPTYQFMLRMLEGRVASANAIGKR